MKDQVARYVSFGAIAVSLTALYISWQQTFPQALIKIVSVKVSADERWLNEKEFLNTVYISIGIANISRRATSIVSVNVDWIDILDSLVFAQQEFVKKPERLDVGGTTECVIKLKFIRADVERFNYNVPLKQDREVLKDLKELTDMDFLVNLTHKITVKVGVTYIGGHVETAYTTQRLSLIDPRTL